MTITIWTYLPPAIGITTIVLLSLWLRRLLRVPGSRSTAPANTGASLATRRSQPSPADHAWHAVEQHWGENVIVTAPLAVGATVLATSLWVLGYIGWTVMLCEHWLPAKPPLPPWFGGPLSLAGFAFVGTIAALMAAFALVVFLAAAWFIGRCVLWPKAWNANLGDLADESRHT